MIIPIKMDNNNDGTTVPHWTLIELQGSLHFENEELQNQRLGELKFDKNVRTYIFLQASYFEVSFVFRRTCRSYK